MSDAPHSPERRDLWAPPQDAVPPPPPPPPPAPSPPQPPYPTPDASGYGYGYPYAAWLHPAPRNGLGTAALVLGIVGTIAAVTCLGVPLGLPLGVLALIFGIIGRRRVRRGEATNGGQALAGSVLGVIAVLVSIAMIALVATSVVGDFFGSGTSLTSSRGTYDNPLGPGGTASYGDGTKVTVSAPQTFTPPSGVSGYTSGDGAYRFTVSVRNTGLTDLNLGDYTYYGTGGADEKDLNEISADAGALAEDFPDTLAPGHSATVVFAFDVPKGVTPMQFDFEPTTGHQDAYWQLGLR
ncbi:DUF4190 domain-containing protein [Streptomyces sp. RB6PN25]|uniref:DUF4190 domain-containing protein n=1 Tax=Streptomyces humicola TaxID=2953240 RepID=A0ABT1Q2L3_9ACTN|nr:DUF4190 domain-containing protein [Streptomyces humicola]MCQ4084154.1 DUF4190 domain-containing protein [Streptomyces humicola]